MNADVSVLLRSALDRLPDGIIVLDNEDRMVFANSSALSLQDTGTDSFTRGTLPAYMRIPLTDEAGCRLGTLVLAEDGSRYRRDVSARRLKLIESAVITGLEKVTACLESRDSHTKKHSDRVKDLAVAMARHRLRNPAILPVIALSARLHDIGKTEISHRILRKPGPLSDEEWAEIRRHPVVGAERLSSVLNLGAVTRAVRHHHERYDGTGYPDGLAGSAIPLVARIIAVADSYDAMTSNRPYRRALRPLEAAMEVARHAGTQFDPKWAEVLLQIVSTAQLVQ